MSSPFLRLFCLGFEGDALPPHLAGWLRSGLGGAILFRRNYRDLPQIRRLTASLAEAARAPILIGVDQEGGRVTRFPPPFLPLPPAARLGRLDDPEAVRRLSRAAGLELRAAGINWNLAPVLDLWTNPANTVIGDRAFGREPDRVARFGLAAIQGFREAGLLSTAKHFPGHGDTVADSHHTLPVSPQPRERWRDAELVPFRRAVIAGVPAVLVAHLRCPALDPDAPSSLSRRIIGGILREELGFQGVIASDDLEMQAILDTLDIGEAAVRFLEAGGDLILVCRREDRQRAALAAVEAAVRSGRLSEPRLAASLERLERLFFQIPPGRPGGEEEIVGCPAHRALLAETMSAISCTEIA